MSQEIITSIHDAIINAIPGAEAFVNGGGGHYTVAVMASAFAGKSMVKQHQLVYQAIAPLMKGENAPVHAIDELRTSTPD